MKSLVPVLFIALASASAGAQQPASCVYDGEWTKCGPAAPQAISASAAPLPATSSSAAALTSAKPAVSSPTWAQPAPQHRRVADAKFWAVVAVPQALNAAYRLKLGSCYPTTCVEHDGLTPNQHFALFAGLNGAMGLVAYKAKQQHSRFWWPVALMLTPFSIYDLQHRPN